MARPACCRTANELSNEMWCIKCAQAGPPACGITARYIQSLRPVAGALMGVPLAVTGVRRAEGAVYTTLPNCAAQDTARVRNHHTAAWNSLNAVNSQ